ncbi:MAG: HK97-gp10 family putative phage morphogenesis protein [Vicinamibacterales bacterium]
MARKRTVVRLEGVEDLVAGLKRVDADTKGRVLRVAVQDGAEITRGVASQLAPRSEDGSRGNPPGFLAANIVAELQWTRTQDRAEVHVGMRKAAFYGHFQETGTIHEPAQPFLRPALDATADDVVRTITNDLRNSVLSGIRG